MLSGALAASFNYLDIAIVALLALFLVIGIVRGFAKSLNGFFMSIAVILLSMFLLGVSFDSARDLELSHKLDDALSAASDGWGEAFTQPVFITEDGRYVIMRGSEQVELGSVDGVKGKIAAFLAKSFVKADGVTMAEVVTDNLTSLIVAIILFILYCIAAGIIAALIRKFSAGMHYSDNVGVKIIDRTLGGIVSAGFTLIFILVVLAIFQALQNKIPTVIDYVNDSIVGKALYDLNPVGKVFETIFVAK